MKNKKDFLGMICAAVPNIIFGFSFMFSKTAIKYAHPLIVLAVRFTAAFALMNILWLIGAVKINLKGKNIKKVLLMALMQPLCYFIFELYGIAGTTSALSGVIISLVPIGVIIISGLFLKEKPTAAQVVCSVIAVAAVSAISIMQSTDGKNGFLPILLLIAAVICASLFNVLSRSCADEFSAVERTYIMFAVGAAGFDLIAPAVLRADFLPEFLRAAQSLQFWGAVFYLSAISSVAAFLLYNYATTVISAVRAASFSNVITVVSVAAGILILGEKMNIMQIVCCAAIICGVYGVNRVKTR